VGLEAEEPAGACLFTLTPPLVVVPAGQVRPVQVRVQPRAALRTAEAQRRPFTVTARPAEAPGWTCAAQAEWVQLPAPRPAIRTWGPLLLLVLGWALAWDAAGVLTSERVLPVVRGILAWPDAPHYWLLGVRTDTLLIGLLFGIVVGLLGGLSTALAARWAEPTMRWRPVVLIFAGWTVTVLLLFAARVLTDTLYLLFYIFPDALRGGAHGAAVGLAGGMITGVALRRALPRARPLLVALGWVITWSLGEGLLSLLYLDLYNSLKPVLAGLPDFGYGVNLVPLTGLGILVGLGGGATTLWQIARARRRIEF
jgi:hypothetical protein